MPIMNAAKGEDILKASMDSPLMKAGINSLENSPSLIEDIANLQILDYLCGNVDRHIKNFTYIKVLDSSKEMYHRSVNEVLKTDSKYKIKMQQVVEKEIADIDEAISSDEVKEVRNKLIDAAASKKELRIKIMKDYIRNDKLLLALTTDKSVAALRESVKGLVKESGFDKLGPEDILKKMNDRKLLAKLGNITKDANSKYSDEYSKRKEAEKKSRLEAQQKKQAARGH